jgi:hypothetical protein
MADSKREAIIALDEWGAARPTRLSSMHTCMIDFRRSARGGIEFAQFGYETAGLVWKNCYPTLDEVLTRHAGDLCPMTAEARRPCSTSVSGCEVISHRG